MDTPLVSVIVPTYNRKGTLERALNSILSSNYPSDKLEIIVIDDASIDGTSDYIKRRFPRVKIIRNNNEMGIAKSRNVGLTESSGQLLFLIDDDNIIDSQTIAELVNAFSKDPALGIIGPAMYYYTSPKRIWCMGIRRSYLTSITTFLYRDYEDNGSYFSDIIQSDDFPNAFMLSRKLIDDIGLFDELSFPFHYEEADLGRRARDAGYKVVCNPRAKVWHDIALPEHQKEKARLYHCHNEFRAYQSGKNRIVFHRRYSTSVELAIFLLIFNWLIALHYIRIILTGMNGPFTTRIKIARAYIKGVLDGLRA